MFYRFTLLLAFFLVFTAPALADFGPKPTVSIYFDKTLDHNVENGSLYLCKKEDCSDAQKLKEYGPQTFGCNDDIRFPPKDLTKGCHGLAYGFAPYLQLELNFYSGKKIRSNIFKKKKFNARFYATYKNSRLIVVEQN